MKQDFSLPPAPKRPLGEVNIWLASIGLSLGLIMIFGLLMGFPLGVSMWLDDGATLAYDQGEGLSYMPRPWPWSFPNSSSATAACSTAAPSP